MGAAPQTDPPAAPQAPPPAENGYISLSVADVLADLPSLDGDQLLMVKALEEAGERRPVILDRIGDLLVVQEASQHLAEQAVSLGPGPAAAAPPAPAARPAPAAAAARSDATATPAAAPARPNGDRALSPEIVDQMGDLLAKTAARQGSGAETTPPSAQPHLQLHRPPPATKSRSKRKGHHPTAVASGLIVPTDGRRSKRRRRPKLRIALIVGALLAGGAGFYWNQSQHARSSTSATSRAARDLVADRLIKSVPAGYRQQPDSVGSNGPVNLVRAVQTDGGRDASAFFAQAGFLHGYERAWSTADQQNLIVVLYHFRTPAGAAASVARSVAAEKALTAPASLSVPVVPGATGLTAKVGADHLASVSFARGSYSVHVMAIGPAPAGRVPVAVQVAAAQYALLPAG